MPGKQKNPELVPPCVHCNGPCVRGGRAGNGKALFICRLCGRKHVERKPLTLPDGATAQCSHCHSVDLVRNGIDHGKPRFKCRACHKATYGYPRVPRPAYPCPYCGKPCRRKGRAPSGRPRFYCPACRRKNTGLRPNPPDTHPGPFPYRLSLYLSHGADLALDAYAARHGITPAQAARAIFREAARVAVATTANRSGRVRRTLNDYTTERIPSRLPDLRRRGAKPERRWVCVTRHFTVALDREAYAGLLRAARRLNTTHQDAARSLLRAHLHLAVR